MPAQESATETDVAASIEDDLDIPHLTDGREEVSDEEPLAGITAPAEREKERDITIIWQKVLDSIDAPLASKLDHASIELTGDQLQVTLQSGQALFADTIRKSIAEIEALLSQHAGRKLSIILSALQGKKAVQKKELKKKASDEPLIKEALELFDGRIIDVIPVESQTIIKNGGADV